MAFSTHLSGCTDLDGQADWDPTLFQPPALMSSSSSTLISVSKHIRFGGSHDRHNKRKWANRHLASGERVRELLTRSGYTLVIRENVSGMEPRCTITFDLPSLSLSFFQPRPQWWRAFCIIHQGFHSIHSPSLDNQCQLNRKWTRI